MRGAGVIKRGGALDAERHGASDDFDAANEPCEQWASGSAARLAREEVCGGKLREKSGASDERMVGKEPYR